MPVDLNEVLNKFIANPQNDFDAKREIDSRILNQQPPQAPNPQQAEFARNLLGNKIAYAAAENDAQRQAAHEQSELLRSAGNAVGLDLSGYGSDVSLQEATRNLMTQRARDIVGALNGHYSKTSDQFFSQRYDDLLRAGYSPRQAKKFAGDMARKYQANRVSYLDNLYNSYGRGDSALSNQILASMSTENPVLAEFYTKTNPKPLDEYNRQNQLEDLIMSHDFDLEKMLATFGYNTQLANQQAELSRQNATYSSDLTEQRDIRKENRQFEMGFQKIIGTIQMAKALGLSDSDVENITRHAFNLQSSGGEGAESKKILLDFFKNSQATIQGQINSIVKQYGDDPASMPDNVKQQVAELHAQIQQYQESAEIVAGLRHPDEVLVFENSFTGTQINEVVSKIWEDAGGDVTKFQQGVRAVLDASPISESKKQEILRIASVYNAG